MNRAVQWLVAAGLCLLAQGCSTSYVPEYLAREKHTSPPPAATANDGATAKSVKITLEDKALTNDEIRELFAQGYKPMERHGQVYYCRREMQTGSRFVPMTCKTGEQIKQSTQSSKDYLDAQQRPSGCGHDGAAC